MGTVSARRCRSSALGGIVLLALGLLLGALGHAVLASGGRAAAASPTGRGDVNGDGAIDLGDAVYLLNYLFAGGPAPVPQTGSTCDAPRLVFVVRHAEKESGGDDPGLTPEGRERARRLADVFAHARIDAIYASEKRRTYETVEPMAAEKGIPIARFDQEAELDPLIGSIRSLAPGAAAVVAGHSYTIDGILEALGIADPPSIASRVYDYLFLVALPPGDGGKSVLVDLRYR